MPRRKYESDKERMDAIRAQQRNYYDNNRELLVERSRRWRAVHKPPKNVQPVEAK